MLKDKSTIPTPDIDSVIIFRADDGAVYFKDDKNAVHRVESYHGVYRIENPRFRSYTILIPGEKFEPLKGTSREFIFALYRSTTVVAGGGGGGNRGGGIRGIIVEDEDSPLPGLYQTLNFEGAQVTVTDDGNGKATITVGGGGMITGGGTLNRIAMFTAPTVIGDSPFLRSGSDVIADAFLYFNSGFGIDVVASGGSDVLNIGAANADVINYGYAGTTHNMNGTVFNVQTTNLNVSDKIITLNDGGAAGSGGNVGFEIEEGGVATGYFIQNTTRNGFDFQASAITGVATFNLSLLTANRTATLQNASGTIAYLSDIPVVTGFFAQNGNSFGAPAILGTNDAFSLSFETSGATQATIAVGGAVTFQNSIDSTAGFRVMDADGGVPVFTIDTTNEVSGFNTSSLVTSAALKIKGRLIVSTQEVVSNDNYITMLEVGVGNGVLFSDGVSGATANSQLGYIFGDGGLQIFGRNNLNATKFFFSGKASANRMELYSDNANDILTFNSVGVLNLTSVANQDAMNVVKNNAGTTLGATFSAYQVVNGDATANRISRIGFTNSPGTAQHAFIGARYVSAGTGELFLGSKTATVEYIAMTISNQNVGFNGLATWGTNAVGVLAVSNGTAPTTAVANAIQWYSVDSSDATATLGLFLEQAEQAIGITAATHKIKVLINGAERYLLLSTI